MHHDNVMYEKNVQAQYNTHACNNFLNNFV